MTFQHEIPAKKLRVPDSGPIRSKNVNREDGMTQDDNFLTYKPRLVPDSKRMSEVVVGNGFSTRSKIGDHLTELGGQMNGPGAINDTLLCTSHYFFKSTRLFKTRRIGFAQIRSWVVAHSNRGDYIPFSRTYRQAQYKLEVEWKIAQSFELVDICPRR